MISKELVSEVLRIKAVYIEGCDHRDDIIVIWTDLHSKPLMEINIYEFAFKCKEWAFKNSKYGICSNPIEAWTWNVEQDLLIEEFKADTEIEAIIKACEWVLKEVD